MKKSEMTFETGHGMWTLNFYQFCYQLLCLYVSGIPPGTSVPWRKDPNDPNDDWCAVCWDGGDLICCDFCPKVGRSFDLSIMML